MNHPLSKLFNQFLTARRYLKNVTDLTLVWYRVAFSATIPNDAASLPTKATLPAVRHQSARTRHPSHHVQNHLAAMNAFCLWLHQQGYAPDRVKLAKLRVERRVLMVLDDAQMRALIGWKPRTFRQARTQLAILLISRYGATDFRSPEPTSC